MRFSSIWLTICQITALSHLDTFLCDEILPRRVRVNQYDNYKRSDFRYRSKDDYPEFITRETSREESALPVTFQAPNYKARDYWRYKHEENNFENQNRRTFFHDSSFVPLDKKSTFPGFYQFMSSLFKGRDDITSTPETYRYNPAHSTSLHPITTPYNFRISDENFIPPPKPIRASVIKLETITRSPNFYPPFYYDTTTKYSHHLGSILNHVLIENSKKQPHQDLSYHYQHDPDKSSFIIPPSVLPRPVQFPPTTSRPHSEYSKFFNNPTPSIIFYRAPSINSNRNNTGYKYPESVQDKLPPVDTSNIKIPYITETALTDILTTSPPYIPSNEFRYSRNPYHPTNISHGVIDVKSLGWLVPNLTRRERPTVVANGRIIEVKEIKSPAEPIEKWRNSTPLRKVNPSNKSSVELITNLTVEGLSNTNNENANIHNYVNFFNMRNLIGYEMRKLQNVPKSDSNSGKGTINESSVNASLLPVNLNDEFSLDAKILKDTHWDGFTTTELVTTFNSEHNLQPSTHKVKSFRSSAVNKTELKPRGVKIEVIESDKKPMVITKFNNSGTGKLFFEIDNEWTTTIIPQTTETSVSEEETKSTEFFTTTNEPSIFTTESTETSSIETTSTEQIIIHERPNQTLQRRSEIIRVERYPSRRVETTEIPFVKKVSDESDTTEENITQRTTEKIISIPSKRKYNRRPKIMNFTPYPTPDELQRKLIHRNNFPKRQKPNITITFGNKNIIKNKENYARDEMMKFSDEDIAKRKRKIGKRRQLLKRTRVTSSSSSESSILE